MTTKTQTSTMMFKSKVDVETSDIFFNFGAVKANSLDYSEYCYNEKNYHKQRLVLMTLTVSSIWSTR